MADRQSIGNSEELILPILVVTIVGMMVLPLPLFLLDTLIGGNIAFSLLLLLAAVHTKDPERFTTLPSILLLSTIFRLGLNISTTRQLLTHGEAPRVVEAFGEFVVGGNVLVGVVVFLIITLVQFIVVSKGAERVAEVAARFTLDAMPGKQMAIDADIRAGILSLSEAKLRRAELQRESKLFGALDGAMKFVKGDAIAGLCITALNISAGFVIGVYQLGLTFHEALHRYTLFTIGESLVAQIPALLVSVAAGVAVTRVGENEGLSMGKALLNQLTSEPRVLAGTSAIVFGLAFCPGIPSLIFIVFGTAAAILALKRSARTRHVAQNESDIAFAPRSLCPLLLEVGPEARSLLLSEGKLPSRITELRKSIFEEQGVLVPEPEWELVTEGEPRRIGVRMDGVVVAADLLPSLGQSGGSEPVTSWVLMLLEGEIRERLQEFVDDTQVRMLLDLLSHTAEDLVSNIIPKQVPVTVLTRILRDLLQEEISVRNLRIILQALAEFCLSGGSLDSQLQEGKYVEILAFVRSKMRRQIARSLPLSEGRLSVWELAPKIDRLLGQASLGGIPLSSVLTESLSLALSKLPVGQVHTVLTSPHARRALYQIGRHSDERRLRVIAAHELPENVTVELLGTIEPMPSGDETSGAGAEVIALHREAA